MGLPLHTFDFFFFFVIELLQCRIWTFLRFLHGVSEVNREKTCLFSLFVLLKFEAFRAWRTQRARQQVNVSNWERSLEG